MNCPSCQLEMEERSFAKTLGGAVVIDLCHGCDGIWFDKNENLQLAPASILELFQLIHDKHLEQRRPLAEGMRCSRCQATLVQTQDMARNNRFAYLRCPNDHGRFITFFHFLKEKNLVHQLTPAEVAELKLKVRVITCSNCGAPVDLHKQLACGHCQAAIAVLDPERVRRMLEELHARAESKRLSKPPELLALEMQMAKMRVESMYEQIDREYGGSRRYGRRGGGWNSDLVDVGLSMVGGLIKGLLR